VKRRRSTALVFIVLAAFGGLLASILTDSAPELGLDLQGGASVVLQPPEDTPSDALDQAIEIIRSRVDALGVAEPDIVRQGDTVLVELPGVKDQQRALDIVGQTAELRFRPVLNVLPPEGVEVTTTTTAPGETTTTVPGESTTTFAGESTTTTAAPTTTTTDDDKSASKSKEVAQGETTTTTAAPTTTTAPGETTTTTAVDPTATTVPVPPPTEIETTSPEEDTDPAVPVVLPDQTNEARYVLGPTTVLGNAISTAGAEFNNVEWSVHLEMTSSGIEGWNGLAAECFNRTSTCPTGLLAITLDGKVVSAPAVRTPSFERDEISISGSFGEGEAKDLALVLRYGALPVKLERQDAQTVSASLGKDSLRAGLIAGAVGTALVLLYMILYYRVLGAVVVAGLIVWGSLMWSIVSYLGATQGLALSLAGVTGIIVSIGVTGDSYVVFFERLKDEIRGGATVRTSVDRGFRHAFRTILIADTSAFIGAATLYLLTVGPVRGFAFFLGLSTILDVTVAWFFTRPVVGILARRRMFTSGSFIGVNAPAPVTVGGGS
jgi:preprotein translocase subunit SecD